MRRGNSSEAHGGGGLALYLWDTRRLQGENGDEDKYRSFVP